MLTFMFLVNKTFYLSILLSILMSISSTNLRKRQLPADSLQGGTGSFIFDPLTETVQAVAVAGQSSGNIPSKENK